MLTLWFLRHQITRGPLVCVLIFSGMLVPALGFFDVYPMRFSFVADHFQYLPSVAMMVLFVCGTTTVMASMKKRLQTFGRGVGLVLLTVMASLTWHQGLVYADRETLWRDTIEKNPTCWLAHFNLGKELANQNRTDEAIDHFRQVINIYPEYAYTYDSLGNALLKMGRFDAAMRQFEKALEISPAFTKANYSYGNALASSGRFAQAARHFRLALEGTKSDAHVYENLGSSLLAQGLAQEAIPIYEKALSLDENMAGVHSNLGLAKQMLGETKLAIDHYQQALILDPNHQQARQNLADLQRSLRSSSQGH